MGSSTAFIKRSTKESIELAQKIARENNIKSIKVLERRMSVIGQISDRLIVIARKSKDEWWLYCNCGKIIIANHRKITRGTRSCGCLIDDLNNDRGHDYAGTLVYASFSRLKKFCKNNGNKLCKRWREGGFKAFLQDMGEPKDKHTLYFNKETPIFSSKNCKWLPYKKVMNLRISKYSKEERYTQVSYRAMLGRCKDRNNNSYHLYGGRGIKISKRWVRGEDNKTGFECFLEDMGIRPHKFTLDRKNTDGHYTKSNCRWASSSTQRINQRTRVIFVKYKDKNLCLAQWGRVLGIRQGTLLTRYNKGDRGKRLLRPVRGY